MPQKPKDAKALLEELKEQISLSAGFLISKDLLKKFGDENFARVDEKFPGWSEDVHRALMRAASAHGRTSVVVAQLLHPGSTAVTESDFVVAGKFVRMVTADSGPDVFALADAPQPAPAGQWCNWPPLP
jgi:hypothetical protein